MSEKKTFKNKRYDFILKLGEGGMGSVYKVLDRLTGILVALKELRFDQLVANTNLKDVSAEETALMNEFQILSSLRHPNIVSVIDYGLDESSPYLTMELLAEAQSITQYTQGKSQDIKIHLLVQLLQALAYLHHRNIVHRDLKPANIIVDSEGILKVLDFGISLRENFRTADNNDHFSGTLAYIAPEVLEGNDATIASDLYAVGIIAYEVLMEVYPYQYTETVQLIQSILFDTVDLSDFDEEIGFIIGRLLSKEPENRYQDIDHLLNVFVDATKYDLPIETLAIRESFLQAASFVGREDYLKHLQTLMQEAIAQNGQICLVAGESGVGKSRLLSELRTLALVERVIVFRGQGTAERGSPYQLWRQIFRQLAIMVDLSDSEASIMGTVIPDIDTLLKRKIGAAPSLQDNAIRERFENMILDIFRRQTTPMILILEDLHWAEEESIVLLNKLGNIIQDLPIFVLGSYRNDETPTLSEQIAHTEVLTLERFNEEQMEQLSQSLLGKFGQDPRIVQFLYEETVGNVFFAIEVIRVLTEEVKNLRELAEMPLPTEITAGGIIAILRRRLDRIPKEHYPVIQYAALYGRTLDLSLLRYLSPDSDIDNALQVISQLSVIEADGNEWRFTQNKLREEIIRKLGETPDTLQLLHRNIAEAIETLHPNNRDYVPALAYHWAEAKVADKAVDYNEDAAQIAYRFAPHRALNHIETAIAFDDDELKRSPESRIMRYGILGTSHYMMGNNKEALAALETMVTHLGKSPMPENSISGVFALLSQVGRQALHRLMPNQFLAKEDGDWLPEMTLASLYDMPMIYMGQGKMPHALYSIVMNTNYIETLKPGNKSNPVIGYAWLHFILGLIPIRGLSDYYRGKVEEILDDDQQVSVMSSFVKGSAEATLMVNDFYNARWTEALAFMQHIIDVTSKSGDAHSEELSMYYKGMSHYVLGEWDTAFDLFSYGYQQSSRRDDPEMRFTMFSFVCLMLFKYRQFDDLEYDELRSILEQDTGEDVFKIAFETNEVNKALYYTLQSVWLLQDGDALTSWQRLKSATAIIENASFDPNPSYFFMYVAIVETCLSLLSQPSDSDLLSASQKSQVVTTAKMILKLVKQASRIMAFAKPAHQLLQTQLNIYLGETADVAKNLKGVIASSESLSLGYYKSLAQLALSDFNQPPNLELRQQAIDALESIGAHDDIASYQTAQD